MKKKNLLLATGLVVTSAFVLGACNNEETEKEDTDVKTTTSDTADVTVSDESKENEVNTDKETVNTDTETINTNTETVDVNKETVHTDKKVVDTVEKKADKTISDEKGEVATDGLSKNVKIYIPDAQAEKLVEKEVTIILNEESTPETKDMDIINHLIHLSNTMPGEVKVESIVTDEKVLKINFGNSIEKVQGSAGGAMFTNSITETIFANFDANVVESIVFVYGDGETDVLDHVQVNEEIKRK